MRARPVAFPRRKSQKKIELGEALITPLPAAPLTQESRRISLPASTIGFWPNRTLLHSTSTATTVRHVPSSGCWALQGFSRYPLSEVPQERTLQLRVQGICPRTPIQISTFQDTTTTQPQAEAQAYHRSTPRSAAQEGRRR
jgi:hypothetical protein